MAKSKKWETWRAMRKLWQQRIRIGSRRLRSAGVRAIRVGRWLTFTGLRISFHIAVQYLKSGVVVALCEKIGSCFSIICVPDYASYYVPFKYHNGGILIKKAMLRTLISTTYNPESLKEAKDICEPDNGHKVETTTLNTADLRLESERLKTFTNWQNDAITPETLAKAGFYSLKKRDCVKCAFCSVEGSQWEQGDDPLSDHMKWAPHCPFVRKHLKTEGISVPDQDVCGTGEYFPNSLPEDATASLLKLSGVPQVKACSYGNYVSKESRLKSFEEWPKSLKQKPDKLSEAGFFYKGVGDQTLCFQCGGGLKDWEDNDDPWEQHALWFPQCVYLLLSKGQAFVDSVRCKFNAQESEVPNTSSSSSATKEVEEKKETDENTPASGLCKICYKNELGVVFIPCGHIVACVDCSLSLKNICPVCRKHFQVTIRAFIS